MKGLWTDQVVWTQTIITHMARKGKMVPCAPRVVWSKQIIRTYI